MGCLQIQLSLSPGEELYVTIVADDVRQIQNPSLYPKRGQHDRTRMVRSTARMSASELQH